MLATIFRLGPVRLSDLAAEEGLNPTMLSRIVGKLESAGLVVRTPDVADGRVAFVTASKDGRRLVDKVRRERTDALSQGPRSPRRRGATASWSTPCPSSQAVAESLKDRNR